MSEGRQDDAAQPPERTGGGGATPGEENDRASSVALLLIDVINDFAFPESEPLVEAAETCARRIERLARHARDAGVPVIYVNDNFGQWRSDFRKIVEWCTREDSEGRAVATLLSPKSDDYFVLKPLHSGFLSTALDVLLQHLGTRTLVLTGFATNVCVMFTANDAYARGYRLLIPKDCTATDTSELGQAALEHARSILEADTRQSDGIEFAALERLPPRKRHLRI